MAKLPITDILSIYQLDRTGNTESYSTTPAYQNVNACISPMNTDIQDSYGGVASYQLFEIFIYDVTIVLTNGDKLVTQSGQTYLLSGVPYVMNNQYLQYIRVMGRQVV